MLQFVLSVPGASDADFSSMRSVVYDSSDADFSSMRSVVYDSIVDGWFRTGCAGYLRDGYLSIHDRVKDMIVSGGENFHPAEIDNALIGARA